MRFIRVFNEASGMITKDDILKWRKEWGYYTKDIRRIKNSKELFDVHKSTIKSGESFTLVFVYQIK